jgi:DNA-binding MarR family transcriptional regulator
MSIIQRLIPKHFRLSTYQVGLLVARTHRTLKAHTDDVLEPYELTSVDWAILGLVHDDTETTLRLSDLSDELGVEAPFTTVRVKRLEERGLVTITPSVQDRRERYIRITPAGAKLIKTIEPLLRQASRLWLKGVGPLDIKGFLSVMKTVVANDQKDQD